ncbi:MAG: hypothetical protein HN348_02305 [Proteobacteria bacterium]|nr:hypothetical protein [Pseudomonadota bacterium]
MAFWIVCSFGCGESVHREPQLVFVRDGLVADFTVGDEARKLPDGRFLVARDWVSGETVTVGAIAAVAPAMAQCLPLYIVPLGDVSAVVAQGGEPPDTALAFSPTGDRLAIGSYSGALVVVDGWTGEVTAHRQLAETMVKRVAWSSDGAVVYAAEQSPDAYVHAFRADDLDILWSYRLADEVGSSAPLADDLYGVYSLPAAYSLVVLDDGDLLLTAVHGWTDKEGQRRNRSRLLRLTADGMVRQGWPAEAADATFLSLVVDRDRIAIPLGRSAAGPSPPELPINGVQLLDDDLTPLRGFTVEPLRPWFDSVFIWEALDLSAQSLVVGLGDGRLISFATHGSGGWEKDLGKPIMAGDVPVSVSIGHLQCVDEETIVLTSRTNIPYSAAAPELRPPTSHPSENTLWVFEGQRLKWTWRGPHVLQGFTISPNGRHLVVGAGSRDSDDRFDLFGALVFDREMAGSGEERLRAFCPTTGPVFFRQAVTDDGRIATAEVPFTKGSNLKGRYQVTVFR